MKKKLLVIGIQIIVIAIVLTATAITLAWFVSNTNLEADSVSINSKEWGNAEITDVSEDIAPYIGQTGLGYPGYAEEDAPYSAKKTVSVQVQPNGLNSAFYVNLDEVRIVKSDGTSIDGTVMEDITSCFYWQIYLLDDNFTVTETYYASDDGFIRSKSDGEPLKVLVSKTFNITIEVFFLDPDSYRNWNSGAYESVNAFRFHDYEFMNAVFSLSFAIGVDKQSSTIAT